MKSLKQYILESFLNEATAEELHDKYYSVLSKTVYPILWKADPTATTDRFGTYSQWILKTYLKEFGSKITKDIQIPAGAYRFITEDVYKITAALKKYNTAKKANRIDQKDINKFKTFNELLDYVEKNIPEDISTKGDEEREIKSQAEKVYEDSEWLIVIPKTWEAAKYYGKGTRWCTAAENYDRYFKDYSKQGPLYIIISKTKRDKGYQLKYQFHFPSNQFMNAQDNSVAVDAEDFDSEFDFKHIPMEMQEWILKNLGKGIYHFFVKRESLDKIGSVGWAIDHTDSLRSQVHANPKHYRELWRGSLYLRSSDVVSMEGSPKAIKDAFDISYNRIKSLEGGPVEIGDAFNCSYNLLTNLKGGPRKVGQDYDCSHNKRMTSLEGAPEFIKGTDAEFICVVCDLRSLSGGPTKVDGSFKCGNNPNLKDLVGGPVEVGNTFSCSKCNIKTLVGGPKIVKGVYYCNDNALTDLKGAPESVTSFFAIDNWLTSLEGMPKKIERTCNICLNHDVESLDGIAEYIGGNLVHSMKFTEEEIRAKCNVKGKVVFTNIRTIDR